MKVMICDPTDESAIQSMRAAGIDVDVRDDISAEELLQAAPEYHGMVVRSRTKVPAAVIDTATNLQVIVRGGVGLDNIDVEYARSKGVSVFNTPAASSISVAELTIGYLLCLARRIPDVVASMRAGQWEKKAFSKGTEISGKTLGLVGCGRIGQEVGKRADALGMKVLFTRRQTTELDYATQVELTELVSRSHYISLHVPHTPDTHHIIGADEFAQMMDGVFIINCGRGGTLDEDALYNAVLSGKVSGAALDVFEDEKEDRGQRLLALPQVIGSPHIGAGTLEAKERVGAEVAERMIEFYQEHH